MLKKLFIQNYAIIEKLDLSLDRGLTIITGETGAGKSILLGALGLIMGKRADSKVLFDKDSKCIVEANFNIASYGLQSLFEKLDLDFEEELIIRREISSKGKSRSFVNDSPTTLDNLKKITSTLIDMHQQFDTLGLQKSSFQMKVLDAMAKNKKALNAYTSLWQEYSADANALASLKDQSTLGLKELDFITFQLNELKEAKLSIEDQDLENQLSTLENSENLQLLATKLDHIINTSDNSVVVAFAELIKELERMGSNEDVVSIKERLISSKEELIDINKELDNYASGIDYSQSLIAELRERQNVINRLLNKHHVKSMDELLDIQSNLQKKSSEFGDLSGNISKLESKLKKTEKELLAHAKTISSKRSKVISKIEKKTHTSLSELGMSAAKLKIELTPGDKLLKNGIDQVDFLFASNVGSEFQAIKNVASGGEMSRVSLCIKSIVADAMSLPSMIFDEIDTGVSGEVSLKMGKILKEISKDHQVISITHSPPIAAQADKHLFIYKENTSKRTFTHLKEINGKDRVFEIAKMMSGGDPPSKRALANAEELITS